MRMGDFTMLTQTRLTKVHLTIRTYNVNNTPVSSMRTVF